MHNTREAIEILKVRAFLLKQEGHKRRGGLEAVQALSDLAHHPHPEYLQMISAGARLLGHIVSGATADELTHTRAYYDMLALEDTFPIYG